MATPSEILTAIVTAIAAGVAGPSQLRFSDGRSITYQSLDHLLKLRETYAGIVSGDTATERKAFKLQRAIPRR